MTNPVGIALAAVHWGVIFGAAFLHGESVYKLKIIFSLHKPLFNFSMSGDIGDLFTVFNFLPILFTKIVFRTISPFFDKTVDVETTAFNFFAVCSFLQCLLIGYLIKRMIDSKREANDLKFSLKNE